MAKRVRRMDQLLVSKLGFWLKRNYRNVCNFLDHRLEKLGITNSQLGVLMMLWEEQGVTQKQIVRVLGIQPASTTFLLKGLEEKGLIRRETDKVDTRVNRIYLTESGEALQPDALAIVEEGEQRIRQQFSEEEVALMLMWMKRIDHNFEH
ncbi:MarR family winged helix-turn-helix transcriptional regulator [Paenibacillus sp. MMS18-CY102]|uniref:MarR family winged helix-turn-helix transcriptional regulator n=1 Tax=Paenibacillus sp. MMS18-CY102 TaxID=2682849 RepID=UPI0013667693|nr:MarR family transcriptional regulator [Paenibacillus sp. MMS18-CY102]MWC31287.1 MarR family transcriptional regulator [Paenibacillus sp. MMS18-CY102]